MTIKKKPANDEADKPKKAKSKDAPVAKRGATRPVTKVAAGGRPRIRASHSGAGEAPASPRKRVGEAGPPARRVAAGASRRPDAGAPKTGRVASRVPALAPKGEARARAPLAGPKRTGKRPVQSEPNPVELDAARELALLVAEAGLDKKAAGIEILDVSGRVDYADFIVVMTGRSDRHVYAIAMGLEAALFAKRKMHALAVEGLSTSNWVLLDFGDVVVHVFQEEARALYDIEGLWTDAGRVPVPEDANGSASASFDVS